jgi:hypothetical protein
MVTKEQVFGKLIDAFITLSVPATTFAFLAEYNIAHAIVGAGGQAIAIGSRKVSEFRKKGKSKEEPVWYWVASITLGAILAYISTPFISSRFNLPELLVGLGMGSIAQFTWDIILAFKDSVIKTIGNGENNE